jgi:ubiquinone/menaquinone biosynthesis C-methylase UbiE
MKSLQELQRNWEGLAKVDPLWAICTDPRKQNNKWSREEFFATGKREIEQVLECVRTLGLRLDEKSPALDFGCGVGRLTRALAAHFPECWGVDISPTMVRLATEFNQGVPQCRFLVNERDRLEEFHDGYFGFIYTSIVLQHIATKYAKKYVADLVRLLQPGGVLVFQALDEFRGGPVMKLRLKLALRSRIRRWTGRGSESYVMEMHCLKEDAIQRLMEKTNARVADVRLTNSTDPLFNGDLQYLDQRPLQGYVSKQYCVVKNSR